MRTTLDLGDDVFVAVTEQARRQQRSVGEVLTELARKALGRTLPSAEAGDAESFNGFEPLPRRGRPVTNELIDRLREESLD